MRHMGRLSILRRIGHMVVLRKPTKKKIRQVARVTMGDVRKLFPKGVRYVVLGKKISYIQSHGKRQPCRRKGLPPIGIMKKIYAVLKNSVGKNRGSCEPPPVPTPALGVGRRYGDRKRTKIPRKGKRNTRLSQRHRGVLIPRGKGLFRSLTKIVDELEGSAQGELG